MMNEPTIQMQGNLTGDPEMRYTPTGLPVAAFSLACNPRMRNNQTGTWEDGEPVFMRVIVWRDLAENVCASVKRGDPVTVMGRLRQRKWENREGETQRVYEIQADSVSVPMDRRTLRLTKTTREHGPQGDGAESPQGSGEPASAAAGTDGPGTAESAAPAAESPARAARDAGRSKRAASPAK